jgi:hypothetical protein
MAMPCFFSSQGSREQDLLKLIEYAEDTAFYKETEDKSVGLSYIDTAKSKITDKDILENIDEYGSDTAVALITVAQEEKLNIKELVLNSIEIECVSAKGGDNYLFSYPCKTELEIDLHKLEGKLDTKYYPDIFIELKDRLDDKEFERVIKKSSLIEDDILYYNIPQYYWSAFLDEEKMLDNLSKELEISSDDVTKLTKVG